MVRKFAGVNFIVLILLAMIAMVLVGIVIITAVPQNLQSIGRDAQRGKDLNTILGAVYQYSYDNKGSFPSSITSSPTEICKTDAQCANLVDLKVLTKAEKYLVAIPVDPLDKNGSGTGYKISKTADNKVVISAPLTESVPEISIKK
jgi:hypothetical protein